MRALRTRIEDRGLRVALFHLLLWIAVLSVAACGRKGEPRAPELAVPEPISDLKADVQPKAVTLSWSRPTRYVDGKELRDLAGFVIFRKEVPTACPTCPAPYRELASVGVEDQDRFIKKKRFGFVDQELIPDQVYYYRVFIQLRDGSLSEPSNEAQAAWRP